MKFETKAIWVGQAADEATGATIVPIYQTSTFTQEEINKHKGYEYSRVDNPTRSALDECLASLEEGKHGLTFSSGLAAEHAILSILRPGDHVVVPEDMYGGTYRLIKQILEPFNIKFTFTDFTDLKAIKEAFLPSTKMVWIETPTNPILKIFDIAAIADYSRKKNVISVVDNTFATPFFQKPLVLGADINPGGAVPEALTTFYRDTTPLGLPLAFFAIILILLAWYVVQRTRYGRYLAAVGGQPEAAYATAVPVNAVIFSTYVVSGFMAALAGIALTLLVSSGNAGNGDALTLPSVSAVVIGGTVLRGGIGGVAGPIIGALILGLFKNIISFANVDLWWQTLVNAAIIVVALAAPGVIDLVRRRRP